MLAAGGELLLPLLLVGNWCVRGWWCWAEGGLLVVGLLMLLLGCYWWLSAGGGMLVVGCLRLAGGAGRLVVNCCWLAAGCGLLVGA